MFFENPQILKQYPQHYFPHVKPPKWQEKNWNFRHFKIRKQKTFEIHMKKGTYLVSLLVKNFTQKNWRPPKWQKGNWKLRNFKIPKQKTFEISRRISNTLFPLLRNFTWKN
jgi:hypothetical protein